MKNRKTLQGKVVSDRMDKTIVVTVDRRYKHKLYHKYLTRSCKYKVHDEKEEANTGDIVEITETRPLSKTKNWSLVRIVERAVV